MLSSELSCRIYQRKKLSEIVEMVLELEHHFVVVFLKLIGWLPGEV